MELNFQESSEKAARLMATDQGKALLRTLKGIPDREQSAIREALEAGDTARALAILRPYLTAGGGSHG